MKYDNFEDLPIWQLAREIVGDVYDLSKNYEALSRDFGLKDQLQRAAISIMNNIAEGFDAGSNAEFVRFLGYSQRSCSEIMSLTYVLRDVYKIEKTTERLYDKMLDLRKQVKGFVKYLKSKKN